MNNLQNLSPVVLIPVMKNTAINKSSLLVLMMNLELMKMEITVNMYLNLHLTHIILLLVVIMVKIYHVLIHVIKNTADKGLLT